MLLRALQVKVDQLRNSRPDDDEFIGWLMQGRAHLQTISMDQLRVAAELYYTMPAAPRDNSPIANRPPESPLSTEHSPSSLAESDDGLKQAATRCLFAGVQQFAPASKYDQTSIEEMSANLDEMRSAEDWAEWILQTAEQGQVDGELSVSKLQSMLPQHAFTQWLTRDRKMLE